MADRQNKKIKFLFTKEWILKHESLWNQFPVRNVGLLYAEGWILRHECLWDQFPVELEELPIPDSDDYKLLELVHWIESAQDELLACWME
ncbi:hypothetical protein RF55_21806, partial [Lasius niger]